MTFGDVCANREFRAVWLADAQSVVGDQFSRVALSVLVYTRSGSAALTAGVYAMTFLPALFGGLAFGGVADRFPHRTTLVACNAARAVLVAAMAVPHVPLAILGTVVCASAVLSAPFDAANSAMLADIFDGESHRVASALRVATHQIGQVAGFVAGGVAAGVDAHIGLLVDATTFAVAAVAVRVFVQPRRAPRAGRPPESYLRSLREGVGVVRNSPRLRILLGLAWLAGLLVVPEGLAAPYVADIDAPPTGVGVLLAAGPAGTAVGSFVFVTLFGDELRTRAVGVVATLSGVPLIACLCAPGLVTSALLWFASGLFSAYLVQVMPLYVREAPAHRRGQAVGIAASGLTAVQGLGVLLGGVAASCWTPHLAVALAGAASTTLAARGAMRWHRSATMPP